jgi:hypothetical protein
VVSHSPSGGAIADPAEYSGDRALSGAIFNSRWGRHRSSGADSDGKPTTGAARR